MARYRDRIDAAQVLFSALPPLAAGTAVVVALPRGGLPIGGYIAENLNAPLDILLVRKVGAPSNPELAIGAVSGPGTDELEVNEAIARAYGLTKSDVHDLSQQSLKELSRRKAAYLQGRDQVSVEGKTVVLVDDGIATGSTARTALKAIRSKHPKDIILAIPVASPEVLKSLEAHADRIICPHPILDQGAVGAAYDKFPQVTDDEVIEILNTARR